MISMVIEMIFTCDNCGFIFSRSEETEQCPDCGKFNRIRIATSGESKEFQARKMEDVWQDSSPALAG